MTNQPRSARVFLCQYKHLSVMSSLNQSQSVPSSHLGPSCFSSCFHFYTWGWGPNQNQKWSWRGAVRLRWSCSPADRPAQFPELTPLVLLFLDSQCLLLLSPASSRDWLPKNCSSALPLCTTGIRCHWFYSYFSGRPSSPLP